MRTLTSSGRIFGSDVRKCAPNEDYARLNPQNMPRKLALVLALMAAVSVAMRSAHGNDQDGPDVPSEGLKVGDELLNWGVAEGIPTLDYKGRVVVSSTNSYVTPPFSIMGRWSSAETKAVLLGAGQTATKDCTVVYVVESRKPGSVTVHDLGDICVGLTMPTIGRNQDGSAFARAPSPSEPALAKQWRARTGDVVERRIDFRPEGGSTMVRLASSARPQGAEPLVNSEFYSAVLGVPQPLRGRLLEALWQVASGCSMCGGWAEKERYGVAIDARTIAYSGCGWYMNGAWLNCRDSDALAVWDRERGGFYFAGDVHVPNGVHDNMDRVEVWPALHTWPPAVRDRFERWRSGGAWVPQSR